MKRIVTGLALISAAALVTATPAQAAAPKDPVAAVKKQMAAGKGVKFTERTTSIDGDQRMIYSRRSGGFAFGRSGIAASDITGKFAFLDGEKENPEFEALRKPERVITVGDTTYFSGGLWTSMLPEGKTWLKSPGILFTGVLGMSGQPVNVAEPATLRTLFKGAKPATGGYAGKISAGDLYKVSPWFRASLFGNRPSAKAKKTPISWRLSVNAKGLPTRLVTTFPIKALAPGNTGTRSVDTRFTGWGGKLTVKAPPADEVTSEMDLERLSIPQFPSVPEQ